MQALHDVCQRFHRATCIVQDRENLFAHLVDQRANALGRIPLRDCLDHRIIPVKLAAGPAADVDKGGACDTVATTDQRPAVAANEGAGLVVDIRLGVHLLAGADDDPPHRARLRPEDLHIGADREAGDAGLG